MAPTRRSIALSSLSLVALAVGCAGPPIPAPIEGEPVCPDVEIGSAHTKMQGGLLYPVRLRILDGKNLMMKLVMPGKRQASDPGAHSLIPDDNAEYTLEWAQCPNERAPRAAGDNPKSKVKSKDGTAYECGDAVVYKTETLATKKHDAASHKITFAPPPRMECWTSEAPAAPALPATGGAAPTPVPPASAAAAASAPVVADAGAPAPAASGAPSAAAPAGDAGK
jgi:hypothetical protein